MKVIDRRKTATHGIMFTHLITGDWFEDKDTQLHVKISPRRSCYKAYRTEKWHNADWSTNLSMIVFPLEVELHIIGEKP